VRNEPQHAAIIIFVGDHKFTRTLRFPPITPYAAPSTGGFVGNNPKGCGLDAALCQKDMDVLSQTPDKTARAQEASDIGWLSFGYFSLSAQRKVSRLPVRELAFK
jgi:hypothetical protein